jgi:hypothetical protein
MYLVLHPCWFKPVLSTRLGGANLKKRNCAPALSVRHLSESQDDDIELHDERSDSEFDDDPVSRQIGRDAARDTLGPRSREHYARYQNAMVSWALKQNLSLSVEKRYKVLVNIIRPLEAFLFSHCSISRDLALEMVNASRCLTASTSARDSR